MDAGRNRDLAQCLDRRVAGRHAAEAVEGPILQRVPRIGQHVGGCAGDGQWQRHQPREQADDRQTGLVAATMGGGHEDHRLDEGKMMDEQRLLQQRRRFRLQVQLVHRLFADRVPKLRAGVDRDQLGQQPALTVADHHHAAERGVGLNAAEGLDSVLERMAQHVGGHRDRIAGIVCEEPELVLLADFLIFQQVVDHVAPAERAGGSAMHQHHGDTPAAVRLERK